MIRWTLYKSYPHGWGTLTSNDVLTEEDVWEDMFSLIGDIRHDVLGEPGTQVKLRIDDGIVFEGPIEDFSYKVLSKVMKF